MDLTCNVCYEDFDSKKRKPIRCKCEFHVCLVCFEKYQYDNSGMYEVQCMNCKTPFSDEFLHNSLSQSVSKRLKEVTKKRLRDEEMSFMPETCLYVKYDRDVETIKLNEYYQLSKQYSDLNDDIRKMQIHKNKNQKFRDEIRIKKNLCDTVKNNMQVLESRISNWRASTIMSRFFMDIVPEELRSKVLNDNRFNRIAIKHNTNVVCKCSNGDCKGFITKPNYECGLCQYKVCSKCLNEKTEHHECKPEDLNTVEFMIKTSKPCPKCAAYIHKIEGCDQMWCTQCNTAFSWKTGEIICNSTIHNPHYYEWMRNRVDNQRVDEVVGWNNCEGFPEFIHVLQHVRIIYPVNPNAALYHINRKRAKFICDIHRMCNHIHHVEQRFTMERDFRTNLDIRMKWMKNEINDKKYEMMLHKRYKKKVVQLRVAQVNQTIWTICADIFHRFLRNNDVSEDTYNSFKAEFVEAFAYGNACFTDISRIYDITIPIHNILV